MRCSAGKHAGLRETFSAIEAQYQKLVYYDIAEPFATASRYPGAISGITFNLREVQGIALKLGEKRVISSFLEEINEAYRPFKGYGYLITVSSTKVPEEFAKGFIRSLEENVRGILGGRA